MGSKIKTSSVLRSVVLPLLVLSLTAFGLWYVNRPAPPAKADMHQVREEAEHGGYRLITTDQLWQWYRTGLQDLLLVDTRQEWEYRSGHIKGAVNFPMEPTWLSRWRSKASLREFLGPDKNRRIVFY